MSNGFFDADRESAERRRKHDDNPFSTDFPENVYDDDDYKWEVWNCFKRGDQPVMSADVMKDYLKTVYDQLLDDLPVMVRTYSAELQQRLAVKEEEEDDFDFKGVHKHVHLFNAAAKPANTRHGRISVNLNSVPRHQREEHRVGRGAASNSLRESIAAAEPVETKAKITGSPPVDLLASLDDKVLATVKEKFPLKNITQAVMKELINDDGVVTREAFFKVHEIVKRIFLQPVIDTVTQILLEPQLRHFYQPRKMRIFPNQLTEHQR